MVDCSRVVVRYMFFAWDKELIDVVAVVDLFGSKYWQAYYCKLPH